MLDFLTTPSWTALFNIVALSIVFLIIFVSVIYYSKEKRSLVIIFTVLFALAQIGLKVITIMGIFALVSGEYVPLLLFIGYVAVLIVDIPTTSLILFKRFSRGHGELIEELSHYTG